MKVIEGCDFHQVGNAIAIKVTQGDREGRQARDVGREDTAEAFDQRALGRAGVGSSGGNYGHQESEKEICNPTPRVVF